MSIPQDIKAMGALQPGPTVEPLTYKVKPMGKKDVDIRVQYTGVCASDLHMLTNNWKMSRYPLVPGHEVVGTVLAMGSDVQGLKVGDTVGLGCIAQACGDCEWCKKDLDNVCPKISFTYFANVEDETGVHPHHGGFGSYLRTDYRSLIVVPESYPATHAGPLMCAGATVGTPLLEWTNNTWDATGRKVGVLGLGGLGHLAVQFAAKMGAEVTVLSRSDEKKPYAESLGAKHYVNISKKEEMEAAASTVDLLIVATSGGKVDVPEMLAILRPYGTLHFVGVPDEPLTFHSMLLMFRHLSVSASPIGSTEQLKKVVAFAAKHNIKPEIEIFKHSEANKALQKIIDGTIRFRAVLENDLI